jgi:hypothetical protein
MYIRPSFPFRVILCPDLNIFVAALIMGTVGTPLFPRDRDCK